MPKELEELLRRHARSLKAKGKLRGAEDAYIHGTLRKIGERIKKGSAA